MSGAKVSKLASEPSLVLTENGVGVCPKRFGMGLPHMWAGTSPERGGDARNSCRFCGHPGRDNAFDGEEGGYISKACARRSAMFSSMRQPDSVKGWGKSS